MTLYIASVERKLTDSAVCFLKSYDTLKAPYTSSSYSDKPYDEECLGKRIAYDCTCVHNAMQS